MRKFAWVFALFAIAGAGCDKLGPVFGLSGEQAKPQATGAIKGKIVDREGNPIAGAKVSNGAAVYYSSDGTTVVKDDLWATVSKDQRSAHELTLEKGEFVLTKVAANTVTSIMAEFDGTYSSSVQVFVDANTFDASTEAGAPTKLLSEVTVPVYGPVGDSRLNALEYISNSIGSGALEGTAAATPSMAVNFTNNGLVSVYLKAPPGSKGATVSRYRVTYYPVEADLSNPSLATPISTEVGDGLTNNPINRTLSSALVQPATQTRSGPQAKVDLDLVTPDASFSAYVRSKSELKAYVELFDASGNAIMSRDTTKVATISTAVTIRFKQ